MTLTVGKTVGRRRFDALLSGNAVELCDRPLLERSSWLVAPTLGAIVPDWLLVIPRNPVLNMRDWTTQTGTAVEDVLRDVQTHLGLSRRDMIWFEHGPTFGGTSVGCGLDHAHLHILIRPQFSFRAFAATACGMSDLEWRVDKSGYGALASGESYFIAGSDNEVISASQVEQAGSQFFRRVISVLVGQDAEWDYRHHRYDDNIIRTSETFRILESVAARG